MDAYIAGIAWHVPRLELTNAQLGEQNPDWDMPRIAQKIGVTSRRIAAKDETSADLAFAAGKRLLDAMRIERSSIDALIFCTQTPDHILPATACLLQHRLGLGTNVAAFDFNQGCSGFVYGLAIAKGLIAAGIARRVLLLTGETYSKLVHPKDRTVKVLFGDAGSATLIDTNVDGSRIGRIQLGTDGTGFGDLIVPNGGFRVPSELSSAKEYVDAIGCVRTADNLFMDGQKITSFALQRVPELVERLLNEEGLAPSDVDQFVFHQANSFMNDRLRKRLGISEEKTPTWMQDVGNTVSATIPIVLCNCGDEFRMGSRIMLAGFGVGYSWGGAMLKWGTTQLFNTQLQETTMPTSG